MPVWGGDQHGLLPHALGFHIIPAAHADALHRANVSTKLEVEVIPGTFRPFVGSWPSRIVLKDMPQLIHSRTHILYPLVQNAPADSISLALVQLFPFLGLCLSTSVGFLFPHLHHPQEISARLDFQLTIHTPRMPCWWLCYRGEGREGIKTGVKHSNIKWQQKNTGMVTKQQH